MMKYYTIMVIPKGWLREILVVTESLEGGLHRPTLLS